MYFDNYENYNPLGSQKDISKCGAAYLSKACLPLDVQSKIENVFFLILFNTLDSSTCTNSVVFEKVIQELKCLQDERVTLSLFSFEEKIYFDSALVVGDNLNFIQFLNLSKASKQTNFVDST